ncbi:exosortase [Sphingomonas panacisoli]|uniref:Exosortase n=1 Tax=Sphingomonas panacisoli TaxID=1813879 RepID=A0A5B8LIG9_9SPHN|nr:exosortase V [Sphingomonas panacisoli]QDZ08038.1 exosortase [Sphingomonas panacisoli]
MTDDVHNAPERAAVIVDSVDGTVTSAPGGSTVAIAPRGPGLWSGPTLLAALVLAAGAVAIALPTMLMVARESWSTEQGAHGPIVLLTGVWLLYHAWKDVGPIAPPPWWRPVVLMVPLLALYVVARISQIVEIEGYVMYAVLLTGAYAIVGGAVLRRLAFPLFYMAFVFPPPDTVVYALTLPMKIAITETAVWLLSLFGYPIGYTGVSIQIGQYQLLVAAACAGLNSIISLSVLATFYIYVRHAGNLARAAVLALFIIPVAMAANFVRVLILILLTYYAGEAAAQGFLHNFAGLTMFAAALLILFGIDSAVGPILGRIKSENNPAPVDAGGAAV